MYLGASADVTLEDADSSCRQPPLLFLCKQFPVIHHDPSALTTLLETYS